MSEVSQIGLLKNEVEDLELTPEVRKRYARVMSSYPAFARWTQKDKPGFEDLAAAFIYETKYRDSPRRQILTRIIQLYNAQFTKLNWETAMSLVAA